MLMIVVMTCSGFTWGKSGEQNCKDAKELVTYQHLKNPDSPPVDLESKVNKLCPGGVAQKYLEALKFELLNEIDRSIPIYENIIKIDENFPDAHGRLGLLQLTRNDKSSAMVSLTKALENGGTNPGYHFALAELLSESQA
jgi:tetratricopeptide (TPR) repeat protein